MSNSMNFNFKQKKIGRFTYLYASLKEHKKFDLLSLTHGNQAKYPYFLESSSSGNVSNRSSIMFYSPKIILQKKKKN